MKAILEHTIQADDQASFYCYPIEQSHFEFYWHHHPEFELTFIEQGAGSRLVGDHLESFKSGDLVLLGGGLTHTWVSEQVPGSSSKAWVLKLKPSLVQLLCSLPETVHLKRVFDEALYGIKFEEMPTARLSSWFQELYDSAIEKRFILVLQLFNQLASLPCRTLASTKHRRTDDMRLNSRIEKIYQYINSNYTEPINIKDAASLVHLSLSSFCKFFKRTSGKTFSDYVNEVRISKSTVLLTETDLTIGQIAHACGFANLSYFNRVFLKKKGISPKKFRNLQALS